MRSPPWRIRSSRCSAFADAGVWSGAAPAATVLEVARRQRRERSRRARGRGGVGDDWWPRIGRTADDAVDGAAALGAGLVGADLAGARGLDVSPSFFLSAPQMAPRMVWCCQPVAAAICSTVAPSGRLSSSIICACLVPARGVGLSAGAALAGLALAARLAPWPCAWPLRAPGRPVPARSAPAAPEPRRRPPARQGRPVARPWPGPARCAWSCSSTRKSAGLMRPSSRPGRRRGRRRW